jgi:hypothetical protein
MGVSASLADASDLSFAIQVASFWPMVVGEVTSFLDEIQGGYWCQWGNSAVTNTAVCVFAPPPGGN